MEKEVEGIKQKTNTVPCPITCSSFDFEGKRHVLPMTLLSHLKWMVQNKASAIAKQIIEIGAESTLAPSQDDLLNTGLNKESQKPQRQKQRDSTQGLYKNAKDDKGNRGDKDIGTKKKYPNYFVAVQVTNPEILKVSKKIQDGIQETSKANLHKAFIALEKFHITLMVMHLSNEIEVKKAADSLEKCVPAILERTCEPFTLNFEGLSTFNGGRVLFADLKPTEGLGHLHFIASEVSKQMSLESIYSTDSRKFNPHLTLMKFQGDRSLLKQGIKKIEKTLYHPYISEVFGTQTVHSVQLCSMKRKRDDGYYFVEHEVVLFK